jgi:hypothetical protein
MAAARRGHLSSDHSVKVRLARVQMSEAVMAGTPRLGSVSHEPVSGERGKPPQPRRGGRM